MKCPKCGGRTNTYRHVNARWWCEDCGVVLREEGHQEITKVYKDARELSALCDNFINVRWSGDELHDTFDESFNKLVGSDLWLQANRYQKMKIYQRMTTLYADYRNEHDVMEPEQADALVKYITKYRELAGFSVLDYEQWRRRPTKNHTVSSALAEMDKIFGANR